MSRIGQRFDKCKSTGDKALVCFLTAGDPDVETTLSLVLELEKAGVDVVELGIPFSDPLADGPSIQASTFRALQNGARMDKVLELVADIREKSDIPMVLMTYFNPVQKFGVERFAGEASRAGADGVIMTDLPPEESDEWKKAADSCGLDTIYLLAPTSTQERIERVAKMSEGFIYCVSRTGVTGARQDVPVELHDLLGKIRKATDKPISVGFGVSKPEHVRQITQWADGAVVGSALIDCINQHRTSDKLLPEVRRFAEELKEATKK
jgi:tryptophan synthase alpha chain